MFNWITITHKIDNNLKIFNTPKNKIESIGFEVDKSWQYAIDLLFIESLSLNYSITDIYLTLISYLRFKHLRVIAVLTIMGSRNSDTDEKIILSSTNSYIIKKMTFKQFEKWWNEKVLYEARYDINESFYGFRIVFEKVILLSYLYKNNLKLEDFHLYLQPLLPWNEGALQLLN